MPNYRYKCKKCDHLFDVHQSIKDASLSECPQCHNFALERVICAVWTFIRGEPKTVGLFAERRMSKISNEGKSEIRALEKIREKLHELKNESGLALD